VSELSLVIVSLGIGHGHVSAAVPYTRVAGPRRHAVHSVRCAVVPAIRRC